MPAFSPCGPTGRTRRAIPAAGYSSSWFAFLPGTLNGASSIGTPDLTSHLAEEVPHPSSNIPKAMLTQHVFGLFSGFFYLLAILYGISDLTAVLESSYLFPLAEIYRQVADTKANLVDLSPRPSHPA
ncbi:MAG: hypothetical protein LQ344_007183 [Seirophora lacunosa]|nr:MAG: hypothetical protein LQ344_007183 [Seirophora lacunosa]